MQVIPIAMLASSDTRGESWCISAIEKKRRNFDDIRCLSPISVLK